MICAPCAAAADARAPRTAHCNNAGCTCGHRTDRYRPANGLAVIAAFYDQLARVGQDRAARVDAAITRIEAQHQPNDVITIPRATTED